MSDDTLRPMRCTFCGETTQCREYLACACCAQKADAEPPWRCTTCMYINYSDTETLECVNGVSSDAIGEPDFGCSEWKPNPPPLGRGLG
jgi:hypothetical protein